jgi:inorganic pyrophosphatase
MISDSTANLVAVIPPAVGIVWALKELLWVRSIKLVGPQDSKAQPLIKGSNDAQKSLAMMKEISKNIADGATTFLVEEYKYLMIYVVAFAAFLMPAVNFGTMIAFVVGSLTSCACGYIGMKTAVYCNVRTTHEAWKDIGSGFDVAVRGGSVMGFVLVSLGVINLFILILVFNLDSVYGGDKVKLYESLAGYGLGGSSIALFARVGGGIYTKAADVGADLSGKNEYGMDEDDPRNPACIADNVGDNVGDIAGMGADLFGSFAESTCAAMVIAGNSPMIGGIANNWGAMMFPLLLSSSGVVVGLITMLVLKFIYSVNNIEDIEKALKGILVISTVIQTPVSIGLAYWCLPASFMIDQTLSTGWVSCSICILLGLWSGLIIGFTTEYYTSHSYRPVREIAETQKVSAATGIIYGLALGYLSCVIPVVCIGITVCVAHLLAGMYGVALGALGMLGTLTMGLTIDAYGPISDNAGGIAEMSELGPEVRRRTDALDAAGNTTAAIGKGFAIGSAALVSLALFGAFTVRAKVVNVDVLDAWTFTGLLFGAMMPYAFSAMTMKSVGKAANDMVKECMRQFPKIISGEMKPDYKRYCRFRCIYCLSGALLSPLRLPLGR